MYIKTFLLINIKNMSKGTKLMADGKKSPEYTRLAMAFLGGVALTVLIMSLTAGSLMQGYLDFRDVTMTKSAKVLTTRDTSAAKVMPSKDITGKRFADAAERRVVKVKDMQNLEATELEFNLMDGQVVDAIYVDAYVTDDGAKFMANEVMTVEVAELVSMDSAKLEPVATSMDVTYKTREGTTFASRDIKYMTLKDNSTVYNMEVATLSIKDSPMAAAVYTINLTDSVPTIAY